MTKPITITAYFNNKAALLDQSPSGIEVRYDADGSPLSPKDYAKWEKMTEYYLKNEIYPVFVPVDDINDPDEPVTAETYMDLARWSRDGLPTFKFKGMDGLPCDLPMSKRGKGLQKGYKAMQKG